MVVSIRPNSARITITQRPTVNPPVVNGTVMSFTGRAVTANGEVTLNGAAGDSAAGWTVGFLQAQWIETNWCYYRGRLIVARLEPWPVHRKCGAAAQCDAGGAHAEPVPGRREAPIRVLCAPYAPACRGRVEERRGDLGPCGHRSVSAPRSSNRTCGFPASGSPTGFIARPTTEVARLAWHAN